MFDLLFGLFACYWCLVVSTCVLFGACFRCWFAYCFVFSCGLVCVACFSFVCGFIRFLFNYLCCLLISFGCCILICLILWVCSSVRFYDFVVPGLICVLVFAMTCAVVCFFWVRLVGFVFAYCLRF